MNSEDIRQPLGTTPPSQDNLAAFSKIFPGVIREGVLDTAQLAGLLGVDVGEIKNGKEVFGLSWAGRKSSSEALQLPSYASLVPDFEKSINWDTAENVFIEGDNLEVLKLLKDTYNDKVKMIYIDPPYNTGNDLVYNDDFSDPKRRYLEITGQVDTDGNRLTANPETTGRKHSNWLNMMYPRLSLARNLLTDQGVIFISIDDHEYDNLKHLCDSIFGESNYLNTFVWVSNLKGRQISSSGAAGTKEYILAYARQAELAEEFRVSGTRLKELMPSVYKGFDYKVQSDEIGPYVLKNELYNTNSAFNEETRPNLVFDIYYNPSTGEVKTAAVSQTHEFADFVKIQPKTNNNGRHKYHAFRWSSRKVEEDFRDLDFLEVGGIWKVFTKVRDIDSTSLKDLLMDINTNEGSSDIEKLGLDRSWFDYPKPASLIRILIEAVTDKDSIVMDFFAGSGTTGHAVELQNMLDGGSRKYVCVTLGEPTSKDSEARKAGFNKVSEITEARLTKVVELSDEARFRGLRVLRLGPSNYEPYFPDGSGLFNLQSTSKSQTYSHRAAAAEVLLKQGVELHQPWSGGEKIQSGSVLFLGDNVDGFEPSSLAVEVMVVVANEDAFEGKDAVKAKLHFDLKQMNKRLVTY